LQEAVRVVRVLSRLMVRLWAALVVVEHIHLLLLVFQVQHLVFLTQVLHLR
jgi:hypothetical protein